MLLVKLSDRAGQEGTVGLTQSFRNPVPEIAGLRGSPRIGQPCGFSRIVWRMWSVHTSGRRIHLSDVRSGRPHQVEAVVPPPQPGWLASVGTPARFSQPASQGTQTDALRPKYSPKQRASESQAASPIQQRRGPISGAEESVIKMVRELRSVRHSLSSTDGVWSVRGS